MKFQTCTNSSFVLFSDLQVSDVALKGQQDLRVFSSLDMKLLFGVSCSIHSSEGFVSQTRDSNVQYMLLSYCASRPFTSRSLSWFLGLLFQDS